MLQTVFERQPPSPEVIQASLAQTKFAPFWLDALSERPSYPQLRGSTGKASFARHADESQQVGVTISRHF